MKGIARWKKKLGAFILWVVMLILMPASAYAARPVTTLRVSFYPLDGFFEYNAQGEEVGYGVELLNKISQYTGIQFEYVPAYSWESTKQMLLDGEADIRMPGTIPETPSTTLSYSRTSILDTYNVILAWNSRDDLDYQDYATIRTLKIAVSESFFRVNHIAEYLEQIGVPEDHLVFCSEYNECYDKLVAGEVDAVISNVMDMNVQTKMLARFDNISNYISMTLDNPQLEILDKAMSQIKLDEPLFLSELYEKWFPERTVIPLTQEERQYLSSLDSLTFAFQPDEGYLAHRKDGVYYGIYPEMAKCICKKLGVAYKMVSIPDCQSGLATTDVYAGFFYDYNFAKEWDFSLSVPLSDINYYIIQKKETKFDPETSRIAAIKKFRYTSDYLQKRYAKAEFLYYDTYENCLKAVENGEADTTVINNYIAEYYLDMYQFGDLSAKLSTDYSHLFCFAAANHNDILASVMSKAIYMISDEEMSQLYIIGQEERPEPNYLQAVLYKSPMGFAIVIAVVLALMVATIMMTFFVRKSRRQNQMLEKALSEKENFLSRMSHDMRTPMNGILGLSYLMENQEDAEKIKSYIPELRESGEYLLQLINDVLDVNRIESGNLTLHPKICNGKLLFTSMVQMVMPLMKEKSIDFHFEQKNIDWRYVLVDEQRVKQIFVNLLSNAVKFTPNGGRIDLIMETVSITDARIQGKFIVRDTGIGMSKEFLPHLFEPFQQENRVNTDNSNGTGLGMSIVKQLVELMGGTIFVESEVDKGTEITLFLNFPLASGKETESDVLQQTGPRQAQEEGALLLAGLCILLCEDHPLNAKIAIRLLEKQGAVVTWAENGQIGTEMFSESEEGHYDVVLMDVRMPVMNGLEAAKAIRAMNRADARNMPIIAMTANAYESDIQASLEAGMNRHLAKPVEPKVMYETLAELIGRK